MISVVMVNFNAGPLLARNIRHLLRAGSVGPLEIIVVDNGSTDASLAEIEALQTGETSLRILRNGRNLGFAAACNRGARLAAGDHLLFLNPDCAVGPDTIAVTLQALADSPEAGMAGCLILNQDGTEQRGCRRRIPDPKRSLYHLTGLSRLAPERFRGFNDTGAPLPDQPRAVEAISGAFMLMTRQAFEAVGGWDDGYFLHCEDLDLCQRLRDQGYDILFVPAARAVHVKGGSSKGRPIRVEWHKHRGMWRFYRKFQAGRNGILFNALIGTGIAAHFLLKAGRLAPRALRGALTRGEALGGALPPAPEAPRNA